MGCIVRFDWNEWVRCLRRNVHVKIVQLAAIWFITYVAVYIVWDTLSTCSGDAVKSTMLSLYFILNAVGIFLGVYCIKLAMDAYRFGAHVDEETLEDLWKGRSYLSKYVTGLQQLVLLYKFSELLRVDKDDDGKLIFKYKSGQMIVPTDNYDNYVGQILSMHKTDVVVVDNNGIHLYTDKEMFKCL